MKELILGGVRSGKSRLAEQRARTSGLEVIYIATARDEEDAELRSRIEHHRAHRTRDWSVIEEPLALAATLRTHAATSRCLLVECLTLWLTNLMTSDTATLLAQERDALREVLPGLPGRIILVSNEVGSGIVPENALARRFIDEAGALHQWLAHACDRVTVTFAGLPQILKGTSHD